MADHLAYALASDPAGGDPSIEAAAALDTAEVLQLGRPALKELWAELVQLRERST
jgi:hypothetical protein